MCLVYVVSGNNGVDKELLKENLKEGQIPLLICRLDNRYTDTKEFKYIRQQAIFNCEKAIICPCWEDITTARTDVQTIIEIIGTNNIKPDAVKKWCEEFEDFQDKFQKAVDDFGNRILEAYNYDNAPNVSFDTVELIPVVKLIGTTKEYKFIPKTENFNSILEEFNIWCENTFEELTEKPEDPMPIRYL